MKKYEIKKSSMMSIAVIIFAVEVVHPAFAQQPVTCSNIDEQIIIDNWNKAACATTQTIQFDLQEPVVINTIGVWFNTKIGGRKLKFVLSGPVSSSGSLQMKNCDPYQSQWCLGEARLNRNFLAGQYTLTTNISAVCQNVGSRGNGFIIVKGCYLEDPVVDSSDNEFTSDDENKNPKPSVNQNVKPSVNENPQPKKMCSEYECDNTGRCTEIAVPCD